MLFCRITLNSYNTLMKKAKDIVYYIGHYLYCHAANVSLMATTQEVYGAKTARNAVGLDHNMEGI